MGCVDIVSKIREIATDLDLYSYDISDGYVAGRADEITKLCQKLDTDLCAEVGRLRHKVRALSRELARVQLVG